MPGFAFRGRSAGRVVLGAACVGCWLAWPPPAALAAAPPADLHAAAVAAAADLQSAVDAVVAAEDSYTADPTIFKAAAGKAIDALNRASGRIEDVVGGGGDQPWVDPLRGAEVNMTAASARLTSAQSARELDDFQQLATEALIGMKAAQGRATELGVFGGLEGALANTVLGIPAGGRQVDACAKPRVAPAWGTHGGYVAWVSVPQTAGVHRLAESQGGTDVTVQNGIIVLHTPAAGTVAKLCATSGAAPAPAAPAATPPAGTAPDPASAPAGPAPHAANAAPPSSGSAGPALPALYTAAQARAGELVHVRVCAACHGVNLHGVSAPSIAGTDFLTTAQSNGWNLEVIRYLVFTQMPLNAAGTLSPKEYADVMAYILASNCFPAGNTPFPEQDQPSFAKVMLRPRTDSRQNALGVCPAP